MPPETRTGIISSVKIAIATLLAATAAIAADPATAPRMLWGDTARLGRPFAKDPSVIKFRGRYLMYFSVPAYGDKRPGDGWAVGIAESRNLVDWRKIAEIPPEGEHEKKGLAAPYARVIDGKVHLFYQTYGNGANDAICHAVSDDGLAFIRDASNPVFHPTGDWNVGRAIDAEVTRFQGKWFLYGATRDPKMKVQMLVGAVSSSGFDRAAWKQLEGGALLKPELSWEQECIEAPSVVEHNGELYMFYAGAYNNAPQQIGVARSKDGIHWTRVSDQPLVPVGVPGSWNSSESGHPGAFVDDDGQVYLFYQGNNDKGKTWLLSFVKIGWKGDRPYVMQP